jgi:uncharacterized RDD family membrane protein YckC
MTEYPPAPPPPPQPQPGAYGAPPSGPSGPRANFGQRLVAYIVDAIITTVVFVVLFYGLGALADDAGAAIGYLLGLVFLFAYFTYFEGSPAGQTPGKKSMSIRVIDFNTGGPIGYPRAFGRYWARILSSIPCLLGYFWMLWDRERQTWHDKICTCVVVPTDAYPVP